MSPLFGSFYNANVFGRFKIYSTFLTVLKASFDLFCLMNLGGFCNFTDAGDLFVDTIVRKACTWIGRVY